MSETRCKHPDIRKYDGLRCCLACGETVFEALASIPTAETVDVTGHYKYTKLNYKLGLEIRLVVLLPGERDDPIHCEIIHVNLDDDPHYDAVSYTWATEEGDASLSKTVRCVNGGIMAVTANCDAALRQLRHRGLRRRLWIDGLCIDQTNIDEKNHQVNLMDRIYSCAYSVRICVQDPVGLSESTDYNVLFQKLGRGDGLSPGTTAHAALTQAPRPSNIIVYDPSITPLASHIFSLRYFKRIWMLQEVVLAKNAYLIINTQEVLLTSIFLEGLLFNLRQYRIQVPSILSWRASQNTTSSIITCLQAGAHCDMTEPRDRIYAVLSLMEPHSRSLIPVDYASSIEAVFANAIAAVITDQQNLDVLAEAGIGVTGMCLDNERLSRFLLLKHGRNPIEYYVNTSSKALAPQFRGHATGSWRSTVDVRTISSDEHELEIKSNGNYSCIFVSPRPTHMDFLPRFRIRAHFIDSVDEMRIRRRGHEMPRIIAGHIVQDPRWLKHKDYSWMISLLGGQSSDTTWEPGKKITHPLSLGQWIHSATTADIGIPRTNLIDVKIFFEQAEKSAVRFFSSHFSLGFTRRDIEKGDEIFAVDGMRTPLILRRTGGDEYRIVAACWLWAALELDCWIPGTKKGRWGPDVERPTVKQTRMIEIH